MCLILYFLIAQLDVFWGVSTTEEWKNFGEIGIYSVSKNGIFSPYWNPANCSFTKYPLFFLESFVVQTIEDTTSMFIDEEDKTNIMKAIKGNHYTYKNIFEKKVISINCKNYALTYINKAYRFSEISKDFFSLFLFGNELDRKYNISGGSGEIQIIDEYGVSTSLPFIKKNSITISSGIKLKYLKGISCTKVDSVCGIVETTWDTLINTSAFFFSSANGGNGVSIDVGIAGTLGEKIYAGISIENLYNTLNWSKNTIRKELLPDTIDPLPFCMIENTYVIPAFKTRLPLSLRTAISYDLSIMTFNITNIFGQYWAHSGAISLKTCKYISLMGGIRYSFFGLSPIFEIELTPINNLKLSAGYHRIEGVLFSKKQYESAYNLSCSIKI